MLYCGYHSWILQKPPHHVCTLFSAFKHALFFSQNNVYIFYKKSFDTRQSDISVSTLFSLIEFFKGVVSKYCCRYQVFFLWNPVMRIIELSTPFLLTNHLKHFNSDNNKQKLVFKIETLTVFNCVVLFNFTY